MKTSHTYWRPEPGELIEGHYCNKSTGMDRFHQMKTWHFISTSSSGVVGIIGNRVLDQRMEQVDHNQYVKIRYMGKIVGKNHPWFHCYKVYKLSEVCPHEGLLVPYMEGKVTDEHH